MSAEIIQFPLWKEGKKTIDSEDEMVAWMIKSESIDSKRTSPKKAAEFGRAVWREFQRMNDEKSIADKRKTLEQMIHRATCGWVFSGSSGSDQICNFLRVRFSVRSVKEIPGESLDEAISLVSAMGESAGEFLSAMCDLKVAFQRQVFGGGEPWTPWVRRSLKREVGARPNWRELAAEVESRTK